MGELPSTYLGLPLGAPYNSLAAWDGMEKRFHKRLIIWKIQHISKGGRLTMIQCTLSSVPIYFYFMLFWMLRIVSLRLE